MKKISKPVTNCNKNKYVNPDYYSVVVVRTLQERDNIPCKLRQDGMLVVVVEEGPYNKYQIRSSELGLSACDNNSFIRVVEGSGGDEEPEEIIEKDSLQSVMERGNITSKKLQFLNTDPVNTTAGDLFFNTVTKNYSFGSLRQEAAGTENIGLGFRSLVSLTTGVRNMAIGNNALESLTTGGSNIAMGSYSGYKLTAETRNTFIGHNSGLSSKGSENSYFGALSGQGSQTGTNRSSYNTGIGTNALLVINEGTFNSAFGSQSLYKLTNGIGNVGVGNFSGLNFVTGTSNIFVGGSSGSACDTGNSNIYIGQSSASKKSSTQVVNSNRNIMIGRTSGGGVYGENNVFIGTGAGFIPGLGNLAKINNKLIIHNRNPYLSGEDTEVTVTNSENTFETGLITGDFAEKWVKLNGRLIVNPTHLESSVDYTKQIVAKLDGTFGWEDKAEVTLETVIQADNGTTKNIVFEPSEGIVGQIGFNKTTYSYYFGNMNPNHTGTYNQSFGCNALAKLTSGDGNNAFGFNALGELTTGYQNAAFGTGAGGKITSGTFNTAFGFAALGKTTTGYKNNAFGYESGPNNTTGKLNNFLGSSAGQGNSTGSLNNYIGVFSGQGVNGNNNVMIGTGAGVNGGNVNNKLVIHGNTTLSGFGSAPNEYGTFGNINESNLSNALIVGDFLEKWIKFNGSFSINPTKMPVANNSYTKNLVADPLTGTFGWEDKVNTSNIYSTTETKTNEIWIDGKIIYRKFITITIAANAITDNPFSNVIAGASEIISFEKCFMKIDNSYIKIAPGRLSANATSWEYDIRNNNELCIIMTVSSGLQRVITGVIEYTKS